MNVSMTLQRPERNGDPSPSTIPSGFAADLSRQPRHWLPAPDGCPQSDTERRLTVNQAFIRSDPKQYLAWRVPLCFAWPSQVCVVSPGCPEYG